MKAKAGSVSLQGRRLHRAQPQRKALFEEVTGENMAQGKDQPLLRHLLEPPELRQRMDEHQEEEGQKVFTTQRSQRPPAMVLAGSMFFPG